MIDLRQLVKAYLQDGRPPFRIEGRKISDTEGEILIYGPIVDLPFWDDEVSALQVRRQLEQMQLGEGDTLHVRINSPGGFVDQGVAIHNTLHQQAAHVVGWVDGLAASAASIILAGAHEIRMPKNTRIMIHNPWSLTIGEEKDHLKTAEILRDAKDQVIESYFARELTASREEVDQMMTDETWLTAERAVELGFADVVVGDEAPAKALAWDLTPFNYRRAPSSAGGGRRAMAAGRQSPKPQPPKEQDMKPEEVTLNWLRENRPEVLDEARAEITNETTEAARAEGATAERERIKAVENAALPGHEKLVDAAKWDGKSTGEQVALQIVEAERGRRAAVAQQIRDGGGVPDPIDGPPAPPASITDYSQIADVTERAKAMWEDDAEYDGRNAKSWQSLDHFAAYMKASESGRVRVLGKPGK